jgi:hypothetical protein
MLVAVGLAIATSVATGFAQPSATSSFDAPRVVLPAEPLWLIVGGGHDPLSNQISIYQDVDRARSLLAGDGAVLFAGGEHAPLAALDQEPDADPRRVVASILGGADVAATRYRQPAWRPDGPATVDHVVDVLERSLATPNDDPLFVFVAGHGDQGELRLDNSLSLWGGWPLTVGDFAALLDRPQTRRSARLAVTTCFGGGFADIVFRAAEPTAGTRGIAHCGVFAAPWDDEASGCDPNPDRAAQESYGLHLLEALAGRRRDGSRLVAAQIDFDGDGRIGLLDAHTRARIEARSIDIPTTTSERWLERAADKLRGRPSRAGDVALPEEQAVLRELGAELGIDDRAGAEELLAQLEDELYALEPRLQQLLTELDDAWFELRISLVERWPELDQPWLEAYAETIAREGAAIAALATTSRAAKLHQGADSALADAQHRYDEIRVQRSLVLRVLGAWRTLEQAALVAAAGGSDWQTWLDLRECERWAPALVSP